MTLFIYMSYKVIAFKALNVINFIHFHLYYFKTLLLLIIYYHYNNLFLIILFFFRFGFKIEEQNGVKKNIQKKDQVDLHITLIRNLAPVNRYLRTS